MFVAGNSCWVSFKYEKLPVFCFKCGCIIHGLKGCAEFNTRKTSHGEHADGWGLWLRAEDGFRRTGMEGKKTEVSHSPACSGQGQSEEQLRKESSGLERTAEDTEASAESVPFPFMESFSNVQKDRFGGTQEGKIAENQERIPGKERKIQAGINQSQLKGGGIYSGINLAAKGNSSLKGKLTAVKAGEKGKHENKGGLKRAITVSTGGMGWSPGKSG